MTRSAAILRAAMTMLVLAVAVALPAAARATYLTPVPVSGIGLDQFAEASFPTVSADGQWVAFQGELGGEAGVWRRNLATGALQLVAGGPATPGQPPGFSATGPDETAPSISANGQFIAFTTTQNLDGASLPADDANCPEVYVADMDPADGGQPTYTLAAVQPVPGAGSAAIQFAFGSCSSTLGGAQAAPGVALSADGSEVALTIDSPSDLGFPADAPSSCYFNASDPGAPPPDQTCGGEVVVSNLANGTVTPVSVTPSGQPTPWGGAFPSQVSSQNRSAAGNGEFAQVQPESTAAISGDGTTVAWLGTNVPAQVPAAQQSGVAAEIINGMGAQVTANNGLYVNEPDLAGEEAEPLWRRIADGGSASTVRLLAGAGLNFYAYTGFSRVAAGGAPPIAGGAAQATNTTPVYAPALSADGEQVAVTSDAAPSAELPALAQLEADEQGSTSPPPLAADLYLVDVSDQGGPQASPLTDISSYLESPQESASIIGQPAISPDGSMIAFDTARTSFSTLASPLLITPPITYAGVGETFVVDTANDTLQLATSTYNGQTPDGDAAEPSIDDAGDVAVESSADNLFYGDTVTPGANAGIGPTTLANGENSNAFVKQQVYMLGAVPQSTAVASPSLTAPFGAASPTVSWTISATSAQRRDGTILVRVSVPGAGEVSATAAAQLVQTARQASRARIPFRTVATARTAVRRRALVSFVVRLRRADRHYAQSRHGLYARVRVTFSASGHKPVTETIPATFRVRAGAHHHPRVTTTGHRQRRAR